MLTICDAVHRLGNFGTETETSVAFEHHLFFDDNSDILTLSFNE